MTHQQMTGLAESLRTYLRQVDRAEMSATLEDRHRLEGALAALRTVLGSGHALVIVDRTISRGMSVSRLRMSQYSLDDT